MSIISFLAGLLLIVMGGCATLRGMADDAENLGKGLKKTISEMESESGPTPSSSRRDTPPNGGKSSKEPNAAQVKQAQEQLKAAGFDPGTPDGILGSHTRVALREYQAARGLPTPSGAWGQATAEPRRRSEVGYCSITVSSLDEARRGVTTATIVAPSGPAVIP